MLRKIIWFLVTLLIIGVVFYAYQYNNELQQILANINFDTAIIMEKIRSISEKLNSQTTS